MTITRNIKIVFCLLMFPFCCAMAQEEYTWEMGGVIGGSFYMGDANSSTPFKDTGIAGGFIARYLLNPHMAIKGNLTAGRISGDTRDFKHLHSKQCFRFSTKSLPVVIASSSLPEF